MIDDPGDRIGPAEPVDVVDYDLADRHPGKVWISCAFCATLVPLGGRRRCRITHDDEGHKRPICLDCTHDIEHAEADAEEYRMAEAAYDQWEHLHWGVGGW